MALHEDGMLWQLLKAYANEDWDRRRAPWPAPAEAFLRDASKTEAAQLAEELAVIQSLGLPHAGWAAILAAAEVDAAAFGPDLAAWAEVLRRRARDAC